ncbi:ATP-binding protein [Granulosicoccus sp. 3-233]|uniref:ATP-binding protein n=1 Tax=Granulosicoccus sp. 3-233 TaxID=3417969 RepID=UPI003D33E136
MNTQTTDNAATLEREINWFSRLLDTRFQHYFEQDGKTPEAPLATPPDLAGDESGYALLIKQNQMSSDERLVLLMALLPEIRPQALDAFLIRNKALDTVYTEFGGYRGKHHGGFLPTLETVAFVLAGSELKTRFALARVLSADHFLNAQGILRFEQSQDTEPLLATRLLVTPETLERVTSGPVGSTPKQTSGFPARLITTRLSWDDLVLAPEVLDKIDDINVWIRSSHTILEDWGLGRTLKPGFRSLFHGPPGTGKTLTATLIGATAGVDVYRIDLSMVVSKYIGETEKNLAKVFDRAENQDWILFFDEADALFAKRTQTSTSNDRHANREVSFLLQRVEDYSGVVILASNLHANIDDAFARRFQSVIYFPMPSADLRVRLWRGIIGKQCPIDDDVDLDDIAQRYELSGGSIVNVVRYGAIKAVQQGHPGIRRADLVEGIRREFGKSGRTMR